MILGMKTCCKIINSYYIYNPLDLKIMKLILINIFSFILIVNCYAQETENSFCGCYDINDPTIDIKTIGVSLNKLKNIRIACDEINENQVVKIKISSINGNKLVSSKYKKSSLKELNLEGINFINTSGAKRILVEIKYKDGFKIFNVPLILE